MKPVIERPELAVYDDFLPAAAFTELWLLMNALPYRTTAARDWEKVWNIADGHILRAKPYVADQRGQPRSQTVVDVLVDRIIELARAHEALRAFTQLAVIPYVWPPATGISWHSDGANEQGRLGAFTYYAHRSWNAEWGGELLASPEHGCQTHTPFDNSELSEQLMRSGTGTWIAPKPNRLVLVTHDVLHKVTRTAPGAAPRLSIQGFFLNAG